MAGAWKLRGYVVEQLLGRGGCGEVWRARVAATGEAVAVKRLVVRDAQQIQRAHAEAAKLAVLDHPHLVRLHALVPADGAVVLVLDLAERGSLTQLLATRGRLTPGEAITALAPVAAAVAYLHGAGVVHGDISAANVLFNAAGSTLLADLGVARLTGEDADAESTPAYVDPVVARGGLPSPSSDVFMLGAVGLHALTGQPPWRAATADDALSQARKGNLDAVAAWLAAAGVPEPMAAAVTRALHPDPRFRGTAADFALDLRHSGIPVAVEFSAGLARSEPASGGQGASDQDAGGMASGDAVPPAPTETRPRGGRHAAMPVRPARVAHTSRWTRGAVRGEAAAAAAAGHGTAEHALGGRCDPRDGDTQPPEREDAVEIPGGVLDRGDVSCAPDPSAPGPSESGPSESGPSESGPSESGPSESGMSARDRIAARGRAAALSARSGRGSGASRGGMAPPVTASGGSPSWPAAGRFVLAARAGASSTHDVGASDVAAQGVSKPDASRPAFERPVVNGAVSGPVGTSIPSASSMRLAPGAPPPTSAIGPLPRPTLPPSRPGFGRGRGFGRRHGRAAERSRRAPRVIAVVCGVMLLAGVLAGGGLWWARHWRATDPGGLMTHQPLALPSGAARPAPGQSAQSAGSGTSNAGTTNAGIGWPARLAALDAIRAQAFATRNPRLLRQVYASAELLADDTALIERLVPRGCGLHGARTRYDQVRVTQRSAAVVDIAARATLPVSHLVCRGRAAGDAHGIGPVEMHLRLTGTGAGMRIARQRRE